MGHVIHLYKRGGPGRAESPDTDAREFGLITSEKWNRAQDPEECFSSNCKKVMSLRVPANTSHQTLRNNYSEEEMTRGLSARS